MRCWVAIGGVGLDVVMVVDACWHALTVGTGCCTGHSVLLVALVEAVEQESVGDHLPWPRYFLEPLPFLKEPRLRRPSPWLVRFLGPFLKIRSDLYIAMVFWGELFTD